MPSIADEILNQIHFIQSNEWVGSYPSKPGQACSVLRNEDGKIRELSKNCRKFLDNYYRQAMRFDGRYAEDEISAISFNDTVDEGKEAVLYRLNEALSIAKQLGI